MTIIVFAATTVTASIDSGKDLVARIVCERVTSFAPKDGTSTAEGGDLIFDIRFNEEHRSVSIESTGDTLQTTYEGSQTETEIIGSSMTETGVVTILEGLRIDRVTGQFSRTISENGEIVLVQSGSCDTDSKKLF